MKYYFTALLLLCALLPAWAQERVVYVDFESSSFRNSPTIPFDQPFVIQGEVYRDVDYVEAVVYNDGAKKPLQSYTWNRDERNESETFSIVVPGILKSSSQYDFRLITYKGMSVEQKVLLRDNLRKRVVFYLQNNYKYDGSDVKINDPKQVYKGLRELLQDALQYQRSKNGIALNAPSKLVLEEIKKNEDFRFKGFIKKKQTFARDSVANQLLATRVTHLTNIVMSEVMPYLNSALVQHDREVVVKGVSTDKERFSLALNGGMYAWSKSVDVSNTSVKNIDFTPGVGFTIPFAQRHSLLSRSRTFDSFGYSMGVLLKPVRDANDQKYVTPGLNLPVYAGLGIRVFKVLRFNVGALILAEKGRNNFNQLTILPTAGLALELNVWAGVKK